MQYSDGLDDGDLYGLLGVLPFASDDELVRARRIQAKQWHPDRNQDPSARARMAAINKALLILSDQAQRQAYNQTLRSLRRSGTGNYRASSQAAAVTLTSYFKDRGFTVVDNRMTGGVLWVLDQPALPELMVQLREHGMEFEFAAAGGVATDHRAAWWTRVWG
ncbi:MAG: J domain-containing protein [Candidatus Dormiibacterota bacterium]